MARRSFQRFRFGVFEVDARSGELRKSGSKVKLQEKPFQLLLLLLEHAGEVVTRDELREALWPADTFVDFDHSLGTAVAKLRTALADSSQESALRRNGRQPRLPIHRPSDIQRHGR
jgi:DNA-binding winged helix-turn-helix (wHTH) protein